MIVTCVTHHPDRPAKCVLRAVRALTKASTKKHLIDLRIQGEDKKDVVKKALRVIKRSDNASRIQLLATSYEENTGQVRPIIDSVKQAQGLGAKWWAKLDDDGGASDGAWDLLIEALEKVGPLAGCAQASHRPDLIPKLLVESPAGIRIQKGFLGKGRIKDRVAWHVVECVGDGCSVFRAEVFDTCHWDESFEVSADIDLAMQMKEAGYVSLMCDPPKGSHHHKECSPEDYDKMRFDFDKILRTKDAFLSKWGQPCCYFNKIRRRYK